MQVWGTGGKGNCKSNLIWCVTMHCQAVNTQICSPGPLPKKSCANAGQSKSVWYSCANAYCDVGMWSNAEINWRILGRLLSPLWNVRMDWMWVHSIQSYHQGQSSSLCMLIMMVLIVKMQHGHVKNTKATMLFPRLLLIEQILYLLSIALIIIFTVLTL